MGVHAVCGNKNRDTDLHFLTRRNLLLAGTAAAVSTFGVVPTSAQQPPSQALPAAPDHYNQKGKPPSRHTIALQNALRKSMPFDDTLDFEEASKGFIAAPLYRQIKAEAGHVAWDIRKYDFLLQRKNFDSIHPSLQRIATLNMGYGL